MIQIVDAAVLVNDEVIPVEANSVEFDEGLGEQAVRPVSIGEGKTEQVYSRNVETNIGMVKFSIPVTPENIKLAREWKVNENRNLVQIAGRTAEGSVERSLSGAAFVGSYTVPIGSETVIEIEFKGNTLI